MKRFMKRTMKRFIALALAFIIAVLMVTPAFAAEPDVDLDEVVIEDEFPRSEIILHVNGRPTTPISIRFENGRSYANLEEAAYALGATAEWDDANQAVSWNPAAGGFIASIVFEGVDVFIEDGTVWVLEDFLWEVYFLTMDRWGWPQARADIPYAAPVTRTTDHGQMAVDFIEFMNDNLYNRVPFSYRELETAEWIRDQLIEMGYDESAVELQTFTIEDLMGLQIGFMGAGFGMYEQFNAFDPDQRLNLDSAIDAIVEMVIAQENMWIAMTAEQMGITLEEARIMIAESAGMSVDFLDKFIEAWARESAPWQLGMAEVFGLLDENTHFRPMSQNVVLTVPGQSERTIIVTAHYCSIMVPGASDNASGVALLLESAYRLLEVDNYFTVVYVFMGAEEIGIYGAYYYVDSLTPAERNNIVLNINADVLIEGPYFFFGAGVLDGWWLEENEITVLIGEIAEMINANYGTALINAPPLAEMPSDQLAFINNGHTVVALVGLARLGAPGYEDFPTWSMYPGFGASIVHTEFDDFHFINETWPNKIGDAMWTFSLFLDYLLVADFDYSGLAPVGVSTVELPADVDLSDHPLVGTWSWDENPEWTFVFNPDGTGARGLPGQMVEFTWFADDFDLLITMDGSAVTEFWQQFGFDGDALILGMQWQMFFYTKQQVD